MRSLETPDTFCTPLHFLNGRPRSPCLDDVEKLHNSSHKRDGEFILECQRGHVRLKAPVQRFVFRKFSISSYFVILVHMELS